MQPLTVSIVQMDAGADAAANLEHAEALLHACPPSDILALPEMFILRGDDEAARRCAEAVPGPTLQRLARIASERECWIVAGSIVERDDVRCHNTCAVLDRHGAVAAVYRKIHLFDVDLEGERAIRESRCYTAGKEPAMVNIEGWRCGLSICYDLRFPELYRHYSRYHAHMMFVPSNFTDRTGRAHWAPLLRARAIENQCFMVAPAQCGTYQHLGVKTHGHSMIVGPWGDVLCRAAHDEGLHTAVLDPAELDRARRSVPALDHRRLS